MPPVPGMRESIKTGMASPLTPAPRSFTRTLTAAAGTDYRARMGKTTAASPPQTDDRSPIVDFENSLEELERLVAKLEQGEQPLEQSLSDFERGVVLFRRCEQALQHAELRVQQLLDPADPSSARPFESDPV